MLRAAHLLLVLLSGCGNTVSAAPTPLATAAVDLAAYATASCFSFQAQPFLKDQGDRWAGAVMQRAAGPVERWTPVADAVRAELKRSGLAQGLGDGPQAPAVALPVMTCGEIAGAPKVRRAIDAAAKALVSDYVRRSR